MIPTKIVINHNSDTVEIMPGGSEEFNINSKVCKFVRVKDTDMTEKIIYEILNMLGRQDDNLQVELHSINETKQTMDSW